MKLSISINNKNKKFKDLDKAIKFLQLKKARELTNKLIKLLKIKSIREWVKNHDNYLPLGSLIIDNIDGDIEIYSLIGIFNHFHKSNYNISNDDLNKLEELISHKVNIIIEDVFTTLYEYEIIAPSTHCVVAKFNKDFSSFKLEKFIEKN